MSHPIVRIPSKLFYHLSERNGDTLVSMYSTLKHFKNGDYKYYAYKAKNNKFVSGYSLLRAKTNLSLSVLKKYVPILIDMGLCSFHDNGDFIMLGGEKTKELYDSYKLVPIQIGKNLTVTKLYCIKVKLISAERQQKRQITKKKNQSELLNQLTNPKSNKLFKAAKKLEKRLGNKIEYTDKTILSNQGFSVIVDGEIDNKSKGQYWKSKLISQEIINSERRYEFGEKMAYGAFLQYKKLYPNNKMVYVKGRIAKELVSGFSVINNLPVESIKLTITPNKVIKPLSYLSFDFVAWLSNK